MKYIFLDIDGVLNAPGDKDLIEGIVAKDKLDLLKKLINKTNSKVIIISSRRLYKEDRDLVLKALDDIYDDISFISNKLTSKYRKDEINDFLLTHPCLKYVILDDVDCNYSEDFLMVKHYVPIDGILGFTADDYIKALKILE